MIHNNILPQRNTLPNSVGFEFSEMIYKLFDEVNLFLSFIKNIKLQLIVIIKSKPLIFDQKA